MAEDREGVQKALGKVRNLLAEGKLWLFLGEEVSSLPKENQTWWNYLGTFLEDPKKLVTSIQGCEDKTINNPECKYFYNTLRMVGSWKSIMSINPDQLVEKLLWKGDPTVEKVRLDQLANVLSFSVLQEENPKLLIKVIGDTGLATRISVELRSILDEPSHRIADLMNNLMNTYSFLFLGMNEDIYATFFEKYIFNSKMAHYMLKRDAVTQIKTNGNLTSICANLDLWEFAMYLSPGRMNKQLVAGMIYEQCYLATQREEYLTEQLHLESKATEILFHTVNITNALATVEELQATALPKLHDIHKQDPIGIYLEQNVDKAFNAMIARRKNLLRLIDSGKTPVKALFFYEPFLKEIQGDPDSEESSKTIRLRQMAVRKYADCILRSRSILRPNSTLELFVVEGLTKQEMLNMEKETFALVRLEERTDEAVCYAETARPGKKKLQTHLIVINGNEVNNKRKVFERSLSKAWDHNQTLLRLVAKVVEVNRSLNALPQSTLNQLESIHNVVSMLDRSIDGKSLVHLGSGSFGDVYKATWNGIEVALKFLKDAARPEDIAGFESEYEQLKKIQHPNIVKVFKLTIENNRIGLIMEFINGGNLHQLLLDEGALSHELAHRCAIQMASAIGHLHQLKMVHRDIKTDNIMVTEDRSVFKLGDFGLARIVEKTEQYKTIKGTYRYMAPEILRGRDGTARYSLKVDVYSYGLILLEAMTGSQVFQDLSREELEIGKREGNLVPTIPENSEEKYGKTLVKIVLWAVASVERRPNMSEILHVLTTDEVPSKVDSKFSDDLSVLCLGTGKGATALLHGEPSSSFVVLKENKPILLVDLGLGVTASYLQYLGKESHFKYTYITHNHADHAAELPVVLAALKGKREIQDRLQNSKSLPVVLAAPEVMKRLRTFRLNEICSEDQLDDLAEWRVCESFPQKTKIDESGEFEISPIRSQHSEVCYGFVLYHRGQPLIGYTGDSGYVKKLYETLFTAPNVILDARAKSTYEHAGFEDIERYIENAKEEQRVFVTGYGVASEYPEQHIGACIQMRTGQQYAIHKAQHMSPPNNNSSMRTSITAEYTSTLQGVTQ